MKQQYFNQLNTASKRPMHIAGVCDALTISRLPDHDAAYMLLMK